MPVRRIDPSRADARERVTRREAVALAGDPELRIVQFAAPLSPESFDHLERHLFAVRPDVALRAYAHYGKVCDLSFLARTPSVRRLLADCLTEATGLDHLAGLPGLVNLETLLVRRLARVRSLPDLRPLGALAALTLQKLAALESVAPVAAAPALERFVFIDAANFTPDRMAPVLDAPRLREARVGFGSDARNQAFAALARERGVRHLFS